MTMNTIPRHEHPRPDRKRDAWINLNGTWDFEIDNAKVGVFKKYFERDSLNEKITVPFSAESCLSGLGYTDFMNAVWYRRDIDIPAEWNGKRVILHIDASDYKTTVYVNGKRIGTHSGGYTSFAFDITDSLKESGNYVTVYAEDDIRAGIQFSGKQSTLLHSHGCSYTRTTGIWQTVWLEYVEKNRIEYVKYYPSAEQKNVQMEICVKGSDKLTVVCSYEGNEEGRVELSLLNGVNRVTLNLNEVYLWEAGCGRLYDVEFTYGKDKVKSYFGIRTTAFDNQYYLLNGKPLYLRTVLDQGFYKKGIYTAETEEELVRDIYLSLDAGFNGARLHQKVFEKRFLYHCDKLGYLVFGETGNWGVDCSNMEQLAPFLMEWQRELHRDFNHPSIIGWCPLNETWDCNNRHQNDDFIRALYYTTKAIDSTRPCVGTSGNYQVVSDIYDLHDYIQTKEEFEKIYLAPTKEEMCEEYDKTHEHVSRYQKSIKYKDMALYLSEYGGIRWDTDGVGGWGYGNGPKTEEEFLDRYEYLTKALVDSPYICGFCYTQLYDVEQEVNGLYTYERVAKFDMAKIKAITQYEPKK